MSDFPSDDLDYGVKMGEEPAPAPQPTYDLPNYQDSAHKDDDASKAESQSNFDLKRAGHPTACIATFGFKAAALVFYLLIGNVISDILTFIFVILLARWTSGWSRTSLDVCWWD